MAGKRTLIRGGMVLSMDDSIGTLPHGDVLIDGDRILEVGTGLRDSSADVVEAAGQIVAPGLVDGHRHVWQSTLRGKAVNWTLGNYMTLARVMYCACFDEEDAYLANYVGGLEAIAAGVTTVVDHSHLQRTPEICDALARGLRDSGVGGFYCFALQYVPSYSDPSAIDVDAVRAGFFGPTPAWHFDVASQIRDTYFADPTQPLRFGIAVSETTAYVPAESAIQAFREARRLDPEMITGHWDAQVRDGQYISSLDALRQAGVLTGRIVLAHNNHLNEADLRTCAACRVGICTTPDTELGMGLGRLMAEPYREAGGKPSLGVDICSYVAGDMFAQVRLFLEATRSEKFAAMAGPSRRMPLTAESALRLAMQEGAESLGIGNEVGSLTPGKRADVVTVSFDNIFSWPLTDPAAALVFYSTARDVSTVLVAGRVLKRDGVLVGVEWEALKSQMKASAARIEERFAKLPQAILESVWGGMFG